MKYVNVLLPVMDDKREQDEVRKGMLDLLRMVNGVDTSIEALTANGRFGNVVQGNYSEFETTGFYSANGKALAWKDLIFPPGSLRVGASAPTFANLTGGIYAYRFDASKGESVHGSVEMQHDYKEGTDLDFHVHWCPTTTNTGNIVWGVEYSIANGMEVLGTATTVTMTPTAAPGVVNKHIIQNIVTIKDPLLKIGAVISYRLFRQNGGTDTFTGNAFLLSVGVHYQSDTLGSRQLYIK